MALDVEYKERLTRIFGDVPHATTADDFARRSTREYVRRRSLGIVHS